MSAICLLVCQPANRSFFCQVLRFSPVLALQPVRSTSASTYTYLSVFLVVIVFASCSVSASFLTSDILQYDANSVGLHLCFRVSQVVNKCVTTAPNVLEFPFVDCQLPSQPVVWPKSISGSVLSNIPAFTSPRVLSSAPGSKLTGAVAQCLEFHIV